MATTTLSARDRDQEIALSAQVWKEGATYVAYSPELDISSCGKTSSLAKSRLREAISFFIEEAAHMGTLDEILAEARFEQRGKIYRQRPVLAREKIRMALPSA